MILIYILILIVTFYLLAIISDDFFVISLEKISEKLHISSEVTGATFMAIGSSAPELFTSIFALFTIFGGIAGNESIGAGTIVGSAIFNILVIIGATAIFMNGKKRQKLKNNNTISRQPIVRDLGFYSITVAILFLSFRDGKIVLHETILFVLAYILYIFIVSKRGKWLKYVAPTLTQEEDAKEAIEIVKKKTKKFSINHITIQGLKYIIPNPNKGKQRFRWTFTVSIIIIALLAHLMVMSAVELALILHVPKAVIGLTILAAGTSIPDLISSIIVAKKGKGDMAITNAIGSNIFDILFGLGFVYFIYLLINPSINFIPVDTQNLNSSVLLLFATATTLLFFGIIQKRKIKKIAGFLLIGIYIAYLIYKIISIH